MQSASLNRAAFPMRRVLTCSVFRMSLPQIRAINYRSLSSVTASSIFSSMTLPSPILDVRSPAEFDLDRIFFSYFISNERA